MPRYELYVADGAPSEKILLYLRTNIDIINEMGVTLAFVIVDEKHMNAKTKSRLRNKGVDRLPALVIKSGSARVGYNSIKKLFEKNKRKYSDQMQQEPISTQAGAPTTLEDMWGQEMTFEAQRRDQATKDGGDAMDSMESGDSDDFKRRMSEFGARRQAMRPGRRQQAPVPQPPTDEYDYPAGTQPDNIAEPREEQFHEPVQEETQFASNIPMDADAIFEQKFMQGADDMF